MKKVKLFCLSALLFLTFGAAAQEVERDANGYYWGELPGDTKTQYTLFSDNYKYKLYEKAVNQLEWLLEKVPNFHENLYIKGVKVYQELEKKAATDEEKSRFQARSLDLYDMRIKYFGDEANVLQYKGKYAYNYLIKDKKYDELYALYKRIFDLNQDKTEVTNLIIYISLASIQKKKNLLSEDDIEKFYEEVSAVIDPKTEEKESQESWVKAQELALSVYLGDKTVDCQFVKDKLGQRIKDNPTDIKTAKKAIALMVNAKCTDDPLFLEATINVFNDEPSAGRAKIIYKRYMASKDYDKAIVWMNKGLANAGEEPDKKAEIYLDLGQITMYKGNKPQAREYAYKAIQTDASVASKAYSLIGDLYFNSGADCGDSHPVKNRAVYLAAYDMYEKAGDQEGMKRAKAQFPSVQDIFVATMKEGEEVEVTCWINAKTTVKTRPKS